MAAPMKAHSYNPVKLHYPLLLSRKLDGVRAVWSEGKLWSRNGKRIHGMQHIEAQLLERGYTHLDGELIDPQLDFDAGSGSVRSFQASPQVEYHVFDTCAPRVQCHVRVQDLPSGDSIFPVEHWFVYSSADIEAAKIYARQNQWEGLMAKNAGGYYRWGIRSWDWQKIVDRPRADLLCVGIYEGKGKYEHMLGGVVCRWGSTYVHIGSGFDDAQRGLFWLTPSQILGHKVEVEYKGVSKFGKLRQPSFKRVRYDLA